MNELTTITNQLPALMEDKQVIFNQAKIGVARAFMDTRAQVLGEQDFSYLINELTKAIGKTSIRAVEIPEAIARGIRKEYGEYYGLSLVTFEWFISEYLKSEYHKNKIKNMQQPEVSKEPTDDEKFTSGKQFVLKCLESEKVGKGYELQAVSAYTFLKQYDLIDKSYRTGLIPEAMQRLVSDKVNEIGLCTDIFKRRRLKAELQFFQEGVTNDALTEDQWAEVTRMGKRLSLRNFFRDMIMNEVDLGELIETKRPDGGS